MIDDVRVVKDGAPADLRERTGRYGLLHRTWVESLGGLRLPAPPEAGSRAWRRMAVCIPIHCTTDVEP